MAGSGRRTRSRPRSSPRLAPIPDVRVLKLNDRGERDISFSILSTNEADLNMAVARLEAALRGDPLLANVSADGAHAAARSPDHPARRRGRAAGRHHRADRRDRAGRHHRRCRRGAGQGLARRPADPGPGAADRARSRADLGRLGALRVQTAQRRARCRCDAVADIAGRRGPGLGQAAEPRAAWPPSAPTCRSAWRWAPPRRGSRRSPTTVELPAWRPGRGIRRRRGPGRDDAELRQRDDHGPDAGADGADPAVQGS